MKWLILLFPLYAFAQDCSTINYLTEENSPLNKIPVADQDGAGICYAYSAAHLMDYHLLKSGQTREPVMHPTWVALKSSQRILYSGFEIDAINGMRNAGTCGYSNVEDALNAFGQNTLSGSPLVSFIESYARALNRTSSNRESAFDKAVEETAPFCSDDVVFDQLLPELSELSGSSVQIFNRLLAENCPSARLKKYRIPAPVDHQVNDNATGKRIQNTLIERGPFTIGYCAAAWENSNYSGITRTTGETAEDCGPHSSLAVGRKMIGEYCHTLVRNTWGTGWGAWNQKATCVCRNKSTGEWVDGCSYYLHTEDEYSVEACYIGQNLLSRNLFNATAFGRN